ncbi:MAG: CinA family protein [Methanomassiliicoccales archaeon]|nr:CinA family protein [Methanomassiliicoccales archaeon]
MLAIEVLDRLRKHGRTIAVAESCTGGRVCDMLTNVPGCSDVFKGGAVVYGNDSKVKLLGVSHGTLKQHGAVSAKCAEEMAEGVMRSFDADIGVAITGIAGPEGGSAEKPVGLVFVGLAYKHERGAFRMQFDGDREQIKEQASIEALQLALEFIPERI